MDAAVERSRHLVVDLGAEPGQAAEGGLDMAARATEPVVEVEVAKRGVEVIQPHQADNATAEPDAFGVAGRAIDHLCRLDELVGLALVILVGLGRIGGRWLAGLVGGRGGGAALGYGAANPDQEREAGYGEVTQHRMFEFKHPSTHTFPDWFPAPRRSCLKTILPEDNFARRQSYTTIRPPRATDLALVAAQIGLQCGGDAGGFP